MSLWDYISQVQKISVKRVTHGESKMQASNLNALNPPELCSEHLTTTSHGRPKFAFSDEHPECDTHVQQLCQPDKALVPVPIGMPFPRRDQEHELPHYHRVMLTLFKPWVDPLDLIDNLTPLNIENALACSFSALLAQCPDITQKLNNMQSLHDCKDSRDDHFQERQNQRKHFSQNISNNMQPQYHQKEDMFLGDPNDLVDEILDHIEHSEASRSKTNSHSYLDAQEYLHYADRSGMFAPPVTDNMDILSDHVHHQQIVDTELEQMWAYEYEQGKITWKEKLKTFSETISKSERASPAPGPSLQHSVPELNQANTSDVQMQPVIISQDPDTNSCTDHLNEIIQQFSFNKEQQRAFTIVAEHSLQHKPQQLRMFLGEPGGTGKSQVINGLHSFFQMKKQDRRFRLASFTEVAAHNIKGMTLHAALGLNQQRKGSSARVTRINCHVAGC